MTYFVGIDIAKYEHVASIYNSINGEYTLDSLHFDNNVKGFKTLLSNLSNLNKDDIVIGFESTAHYHLSLFSYLTKKHFICHLINPIVTSKFRSISLRNAKNDNIDSRTIALYLSFDYSRLLKQEFESNELKELCIQRDSLIKDSSKLKIKLLTYLDRVFPELETIVGKQGIHSKAIRAILKDYPTAHSIASTRIDHLINLSNKASRKRFPTSKVRKIKEVAKISIGYHSSAISLKIQQSILTLETLEKQTDEINEAIIHTPCVMNSPLHKIKGINSIEIAYIMSAIININRFSDPNKLIAYAGLDPKVRQSGTWAASSTRMSKRGNKLLRYALKSTCIIGVKPKII